MAGPRILAGGVPLGLDNIGDEAILACAVRILREVCPDCRITVATNDGPATAKKLDVETAPLLGFNAPGETAPDEWRRIAESIRSHDVFFWCGATGLSDYPEVPLEMVRLAKDAGEKAIVWGVGMNDALNPIKYRVLRGRRRRLLEAIRALTFGVVDAVAMEEDRREAGAKRMVREQLERADLVVTRDPESRHEIALCGVQREIVVGADSALILGPSAIDAVRLSNRVRALLASPRKKVGICISAQQALRDDAGLVGFIDGLLAGGLDVLFLPMNPETDAKLMNGILVKLRHIEHAATVEGIREPEDVLAIASRMDVIISSRLHLLIFASIVHVPIIGIGRGSKVNNFLKPYGLRPAGTVEVCDFAHLESETQRFLTDPESFKLRSRAVREELLARLDHAKERLAKTLT